MARSVRSQGFVLVDGLPFIASRAGESIEVRAAGIELGLQPALVP
jgi:hypothetical protein